MKIRSAAKKEKDDLLAKQRGNETKIVQILKRLEET
jgi:hypothetical protein